MSFDFDSKPKGEVDPTSDFLERERQALGALGGGDDLLSGGAAGAGSGGDKTADDFERGASAFPALDGEDDIGGFGSTRAPAAAASSAPAPAASTPAAAQSGGGDLFGFDDDTEKEKKQFESQYPAFNDPDLDAPAPAPAAAAPAQPAAPASNGFSSQPKPTSLRNAYGDDEDDEEEPAPIREWRLKQADEIAARTATAERKKGEAISKAEREIDQFYEEYNAKKEKTIAKNKENEAAFQAQREKELAEGTTWQRINKLLDLKDGQNKTIAKPPPGVSDTSRMREIYLTLAKEGETAPGASGY